MQISETAKDFSLASFRYLCAWGRLKAGEFIALGTALNQDEWKLVGKTSASLPLGEIIQRYALSIVNNRNVIWAINVSPDVSLN